MGAGDPIKGIDRCSWMVGLRFLPRVLTLGANGDLQMEVASEFATLQTKTAVILQPHDSAELGDALSRATISGRAGHVQCTFKVGESSCGLDLRLGTREDGASLLAIAYDGANDQPIIYVGDKAVPLNQDRDGLSTLHIWIDGSVIETFVDKRHAITTRCYSAAPEPAGIRLAWNGAVDSLKNLTVSELKAISDDRLAS